ncbi:hypothetical protein DQ240_22520 [Blastococcus sp. TF02A-26]|nr:hypothetical protein DQ240_22520 [Blastococcus sp. TF02A-26]
MRGSKQITWETCPRCRDDAAVEWRKVGESFAPVAIECSSGCRLRHSELVREFRPRHPRETS